MPASCLNSARKFRLSSNLFVKTIFAALLIMQRGAGAPLSELSLLGRIIVKGSEPCSWVKVKDGSDALFQWVPSRFQLNLPELGDHRFGRGKSGPDT